MDLIIRIIVFTIPLFVLFSCQKNVESKELYSRFSDYEIQEIFIKELKLNHIKFRAGEDGGIYYNSKDYSKVQIIKQNIIGDNFNGNSVTFPNEKYIDIFKRNLDGLGIHYKSFFRSGREYVSWDEKDNEIVKKNIGFVKDFINRDKMRDFIEKSKS
ncbi:MAG: hypothetical protein ACC707_19905 [Thiohalomonadales bacterium]